MEIPNYWRLKAQRYRLEGSTCPICGQVTFPPRPVCPDCSVQPRRIAGGGLSVIPPSMDIADIESHLRYDFIERVIG